MAYYLNLFSPETYATFSKSDRTISGFRISQRNVSERIKVGDIFICYVTRISRWVGLLEVESGPFQDNTPIFMDSDDPFIVRFKVKSIVWLALDKSIPTKEDLVWNKISFTKGHNKSSTTWTGSIRNSLREMTDIDGKLIFKLLNSQVKTPIIYSLTEDDKRKLTTPTVKTQNSKEVAVSIPQDEELAEIQKTPIIRESIKIQGILARIGERMNLKVWIPKNDRERVLKLWKPQSETLLDSLPLNYDDTTLKTIENIDVLWVRRRSIVRAFEVEHTTSIYSGILRMADLMALQPNLDIKAHIVAPLDRRDKVLQEITRPVFTLLEKGPLAESCSFLSYDSVIELSKEKRLEYMNDGVLEEYIEEENI